MRLPILLACLVLAACGDPEPLPVEPVAAPAAAAGSATPSGTELRDAVRTPIEKAEAVEDQTLDAAEEQRQQIQDAGG